MDLCPQTLESIGRRHEDRRVADASPTAATRLFLVDHFGPSNRPVTPDIPKNELSAHRMNLPGWVLWLVAVVFLAIAGVYAYSITFSQFAYYDDEGFMMITVRGFLEGHPLYKEVFTAYGPAYYFYEWLLHRLAGLPLTHDATGLLCVVHWIAAGTILAFAAYRASGAPLLGFFVFMQCTVHLEWLANEPGHPQELAVLLLALAALIAARPSPGRWTLAWLGGIGASLVLIKINIGVFYGMALFLALLCHSPLFLRRRAWFYGVLAASSALPFLLMRGHLAASWARDYSWEIGAAVLTGGIVAYGFGARPPVALAHWCGASGGFGGLAAFFIGLALLTGTSLPAMVECLVVVPSKLASGFCAPLRGLHAAWSATGAILMAAVLVAWRSRLERWRLAMAALKAIYGVLGTYVLVSDPHTQLGYLLPWAWLVLVLVPEKPDAETSGGFFRTFLCLAAAWQGLQAYPIAGTQAATGTLLLVLVCSLCLHDALVALTAESRLDQSLGALAHRQRLLFKYLLFAGMLYLFAATWCVPASAWRYRKSLTSLDLPGAHHVRLSAPRAASYRELTEYLQRSCEAFVTFPGFNSLYFWTAKPPPTYFNAAEVMLLGEREQNQVVAALKQARQPLIVINTAKVPFATESDILGKGPLLRFIREEWHEVKRLDTFRILAPN